MDVGLSYQPRSTGREEGQAHVLFHKSDANMVTYRSYRNEDGAGRATFT